MDEDDLERMVTAVIACVMILGSIVITIMGLKNPHSSGVPAWITTATTMIIGYYFGHYHRGGNGHA